MEKRASRGLMAAVSTVTFLLLGLIYAWSVISIEIAKVFPGYTATQLSLSFTITSVFFCFGGFFSGHFSKKLSPAFSLRISALCFVIAYWGSSLMQLLQPGPALAVLYVFYSVFAGFATGISHNALMTNVSPWFPEHLGLVSGVMGLGFGLSSLGYALVIERLITSFSIFAIMRIFGTVVPLAVLTASFFVKKPPVKAQEAAEGEGARSYTPLEMLSKPSFWIYFAWNSVCGGAGLMIINSAGSIAEYFGLIASMGMVISVFNGCGRPLAGALVDKLGQFGSMLVMVFALIGASLMLILADRGGPTLFMFIGLVLVGVIYGGGSIISTKVIRDLYGPAYFGTNHSLSNFCMISGSFIGPLLSGVLQDCSGGGFTGTFAALLCMGVLMLILLLVLRICVSMENKA